VNESLHLHRIRRKSLGGTVRWREEALQSRSSRQPLVFLTVRFLASSRDRFPQPQDRRSGVIWSTSWCLVPPFV